MAATTTTEIRSEERTGRMVPSGASVVLDHLDKRFGGVVAVDDLSLAIKPGEFITFLGPSGSGKTTTLMMIAGFEFPSGGEIFIDEAPIVQAPPYRRNIGMGVPELRALSAHDRRRECRLPAAAARRRKAGKSPAASPRSSITVQLAGYQARYPRQLSGGQQQTRRPWRRAIVFNPASSC